MLGTDDFSGRRGAMDDWAEHSQQGWPATERRERLEYLADLLNELQVLAERDGCRKLPAMLAISRAEALREALKGAA